MQILHHHDHDYLHHNHLHHHHLHHHPHHHPHASEIGRDIHVAAAEVKLDASFGENAAKFFYLHCFQMQ